jgi:hypothetical protein
MLKAYDQYVLIPQIRITEQEIQSYYDENLDKFSDGEFSIISFKIFESEIEAFEYYNQHHHDFDSLFPDTDSLDMIKYSLRYDSPIFPQFLRVAIFNLKDNTALLPFKVGNRYYIFYKHSEVGIRTKPIGEIKASIRNVIQNSKLCTMKGIMSLSR